AHSSVFSSFFSRTSMMYILVSLFASISLALYRALLGSSASVSNRKIPSTTYTATENASLSAIQKSINLFRKPFCTYLPIEPLHCFLLNLAKAIHLIKGQRFCQSISVHALLANLTSFNNITTTYHTCIHLLRLLYPSNIPSASSNEEINPSKSSFSPSMEASA